MLVYVLSPLFQWFSDVHTFPVGAGLSRAVEKLIGARDGEEEATSHTLCQ
jgi:hypothetical protein